MDYKMIPLLSSSELEKHKGKTFSSLSCKVCVELTSCCVEGQLVIWVWYGMRCINDNKIFWDELTLSGSKWALLYHVDF